MFLQEFNMFFTRELETLKNEIAAYNTEVAIWAVPEGISNSGGTLALHLVGNLNHFVGSVLGDTGYVREREKEFTERGVPQAELLKMIEDTSVMVTDVILNLNEQDFGKDLPIQVMNRSWTYHSFMLQLLWHLSYHNGQINYHRRLSDI